VLIDLKKVSFISSDKEERKNIHSLFKLFQRTREQLIKTPYLINQQLCKAQKNRCEYTLDGIRIFSHDKSERMEAIFEIKCMLCL
jgi:ATP-dependent DNA ligase